MLFLRFSYIFMHMHVYPCISMHIHAYPCLSMHIHAYPHICMYIHAYPCISMLIHAYPWDGPLAAFRCLQMLPAASQMGPQKCSWAGFTIFWQMRSFFQVKVKKGISSCCFLLFGALAGHGLWLAMVQAFRHQFRPSGLQPDGASKVLPGRIYHFWTNSVTFSS